MEIIVVVLVLGFLATPVMAWVALARTSELRRSIASLELDVRNIRLRLAAMQRASAPPSPVDEDVESALETGGEHGEKPVLEVHESPSPRPAPPGPLPSEDPTPAGPPAAVDRPDSGAAPDPEPVAGSQGTAAGAHSGAQEAPDAPGIETVIGTTWVLWIGLGVLAIALALFARTVAPMLTPGAKVAVAYAGAVALFAAGRLYENKLDRFARPVMAGALAFGFFVAYAAHFVPAMRAIPLVASAIWMGFGMATLLVAAERWRSQNTAVLAFMLGHVSAYVAAGQADAYSLVILAALAVTAVVLLLRHGWVELGVLAVALSYAAHVLWIFAERGPVDGDPAFWLNLAFLSTYYAIFLIADVLWWRRDADRESYGSRSVLSPRHLGPANMVFYASAASFVYLLTGAHLESIEWFYFTLAALQCVVARIYWELHHHDYAFYPVFGAILWTLGMFAALDSLTLNLVLAGQAVLLLAAAHHTRLWVFHGLAQAALVVSLVHYWVYPRPAESTWSLFLGGIGIVGVYLVMAGLEEAWYGEEEVLEPGRADENREGGLARAFRRRFGPVAPFLAPVHATLGAVVLLREGLAHFGMGTELGWLLAVAALSVTATVVVRRRTALMVVPTFLALSATVLVAGIPDPSGSLVLVAGLSFGTLVLVLGTERRLAGQVSEAAVWHARVRAGLLLVAAAVASFAAPWAFPWGAGWLLVPVLVLGIQDRLARVALAGVLPLFLPCAAGALVIRIVWAGVGVVPEAMMWVAGGTAVLMAAAALRRDRGLFAAGYVLMAVGYLVFLAAPAGTEPLLYAVLGAPWSGMLVAMVPLVVALALDRRGPDREWDPSTLDTAQGLTFGAYALGFVLAGVLGHLHLHTGSGWSKVAGAAGVVALIASSRRLGTPLLVPSAVAGLIVLHGLVLGSAVRPDGFEAGLTPLVLFGILTLAGERVVRRVRPGGREGGFDRGMAAVLVALAATTVMAAVYRSPVLGPTWATAGWSVGGGLLMAAGFVLASALHRRVALAILAVSLVRVFLVDSRQLSDAAEIAAFLVLGLSLVGVAWLYARYQERVMEWF